MDVRDDGCTLRYPVSLVRVVLFENMWDADPRRRRPTKDFFEHGLQIGKVGRVGAQWKTVGAHDAIELGLDARLDMRVESHEEDEGSEARDGSIGTTGV